MDMVTDMDTVTGADTAAPPRLPEDDGAVIVDPMMPAINGTTAMPRQTSRTSRQPPAPAMPAGPDDAPPVIALLDMLGRRWMLRVLWALRAGALTFRDLQETCDGMSPSVLSRRLAELREMGLIEPPGSGDGYRLTSPGQELVAVLTPVSFWAERWRREIKGRDVS
ncbi:winged helix-turn-helix transcriptional regulator [Tistrella bauzanensis]